PERFKVTFREALDTAEPYQPPLSTESELTGVEKVMADFNKRYAVVNENGKVLVYERMRDPILGRSVIVRIPFADLKKLYQNQHVSRPDGRGDVVIKSAADWWLNDPDRRTYLDGVTFDPTNSVPPTYWNLWNGFAEEPRAGDWGLMRRHVQNV